MSESTLDTHADRRHPKVSDVVGTAILAAVGLAAVVMGLGYGFIGENGQIGPGFLPVLVGGFILVASLAEIGRLFLAPPGQSTAGLGGVADQLSAEAKAAERAAHEDLGSGSTADQALGDSAEELDTFGRTAKQRNRTVALIFVILLGAMLLMQVIGMLLALTVTMFTIIVFVEKKPLVTALLASAGALLVTYLIFVQMLGVPVPQGMLGIL